MRLTSKPQARRPATTGSRRPVGLTGTSGGAGDDLLTFLQLAAPQRDHLLAHVVEDRIDLRLLVGGEIERLDESLAHLLRAAGAATLATTTGWSAAARRRPAARMTARWRRVTGFAGGAEAK